MCPRPSPPLPKALAGAMAASSLSADARKILGKEMLGNEFEKLRRETISGHFGGSPNLSPNSRCGRTRRKLWPRRIQG